MRLSHEFLLGFVLALVVGCSGVNPKPPQAREAQDVEAIVQIIENCPSWIDTKPTDVKLRCNIVGALGLITKFDVEDVRKAERAFLASPSGGSLPGEAKLFLLHRLLFKVPQRANGELARKSGGWQIPSDAEGYEMLWPLRETREGGMVLDGEYLGYMGPEYDPLAEFDFFRDKLGVRTPM